jgi:hypothetical protein
LSEFKYDTNILNKYKKRKKEEPALTPGQVLTVFIILLVSVEKQLSSEYLEK